MLMVLQRAEMKVEMTAVKMEQPTAERKEN
jgi:hypothetical protein